MLSIASETLDNFIIHNIFSKCYTTLGFRPQFSECDCYKNGFFFARYGVPYCPVSDLCHGVLFKAHL